MNILYNKYFLEWLVTDLKEHEIVQNIDIIDKIKKIQSLINKINVIDADINYYMSYEYFSEFEYSKLKLLRKKVLNELFSDNIRVSVNIMTYNEERCIRRCLNSIYKIADEIIIVDTGSTDNTVKIIKDFPKVKLYFKQWNEDFSEIRNYMKSKSTGEWIFTLDADEYLYDDELEMFNIVKLLHYFENKCLVVSPIIDNLNKDQIILSRRFFRNVTEIRYYGIIHEYLRYKDKDFLFADVAVNLKIYHDGYDENIIDHKDKINRNIKLLTKMIKTDSENLRWYYFLSREKIILFKKIQSLALLEETKNILEQCISKIFTKNDFENSKLNILLNLCFVYLELDDSKGIYETIEFIKQEYPQNIDVYHYELIYNYKKFIKDLTISTNRSLNELSIIEEYQSVQNNDIKSIYKILSMIFLSQLEFDKFGSVVDKLKLVDESNIQNIIKTLNNIIKDIN